MRKQLLKRAEKNPLYLIATTYGEQSQTGSFEGEFEASNRRIWNGLMAQGFDSESRSKIAKIIKVEKDELDPLGNDEFLLVKARLTEAGFSEDEIPKNEDFHGFSVLDFRNLIFSKSLLMSNRLFSPFLPFSMVRSLTEILHFLIHYLNQSILMNLPLREMPISVMPR